MATPANPTSLPIQWAPLTSEECGGNASMAAAFNQRLGQLFNAASASQGAAGKPIIPSGIDVAGAPISNVGEPQSPTDAISKSHAEANYSAAALAPQLEAGGPHSFKGYRSLNSKSQQESYSTFLNRVANTTPTTNSTVVTAGPPSGGNVTITIPAGQQLLMDGSVQTFGTFTVTVALPSSQAIASIVRTSGVVTASGSFTGLTAGESIYVSGVSDSSFDGDYELLTAGGSTLTWAQLHFVDASSTSGFATTGGAYYFYLKYPSQTLDVVGPMPQDSQLNRLQSNLDNQTLIAVAVVNASGLVTQQSAGGATVPIATNNGNHILSRL